MLPNGRRRKEEKKKKGRKSRIHIQKERIREEGNRKVSDGKVTFAYDTQKHNLVEIAFTSFFLLSPLGREKVERFHSQDESMRVDHKDKWI